MPGRSRDRILAVVAGIVAAAVVIILVELQEGDSTVGAADLGAADFDAGRGPACPPPGQGLPAKNTLEVTYGRGWSDGVVRPLSEAAARARDEAGEPYVAVLHDGDRVVAQVRVARASGTFEVATRDDQGRTIAFAQLRDRQDGSIFLRAHETWTYRPGDTRKTAHHRSVAYQPDNYCRATDAPRGREGSRREVHAQADLRTGSSPAFGAWENLLELAGYSDARIIAAQQPLPVGDGPAWEPRPPLRPDDVDARFRAGAEHLVQGEPATIAHVPAGELRLRSGRVAVRDPGWLEDDVAALAAEVPPGTYPVTLVVAKGADDGSADGLVAAARLQITDAAVETWELALKNGQDPLFLGPGQFYGTGVDAGTVAFLDPDAAPALVDDLENDGPWDALRGRWAVTVGDNDLVMFRAGFGDGSYPTWVGRDADGAVVSFVLDLQVIDGGE